MCFQQTSRVFIKTLTVTLCASLLVVASVFLNTSFHGSPGSTIRNYFSSSCYPNFDSLSHVWVLRNESTFQSVDNDGSYVYSAYLDDREAPDVENESLPIIRILAWIKADKWIVEHWKCLLWFHGHEVAVETDVSGWTHFNRNESNFVSHGLAAAMVICPSRRAANRTENNTTNTRSPFAVSLVRKQHCKFPRNTVPVINLMERRWKSDHIVHTQRKQKDNITNKLNFTVCVHSPLFGTRYLMNDLAVFIETNRVFGAQRFVFYVESADRKLLAVLRHYEQLGIVEVRLWPLPRDIARVVDYHGQTMVMNDCLYRMMYLTTYIASHDLDEFIVPTTADNWQSMINNINAKLTQPENVASYNFRHRFFPTDLPDDAYYLRSADSDVNNYRLTTSLKVSADSQLLSWVERSKVIGRPERLLMWHVHLIDPASLIHSSDINVLVNATDGTLHHYRNGVVVNSTTNLLRMRFFEKRITKSLKHVTQCLSCHVTVYEALNRLLLLFL